MGPPKRRVSEQSGVTAPLSSYFFFLILFGLTRAITGFSGRNRDFLLGLFQEMFDHWDHPLWFGKQGEVTGIRDHREFSVGDELKGINCVFKADKIVISQDDKKGRFDGS